MIEPIPMEKWGRDHWTTFAYLGNCIVDRAGIVDIERMRNHPKLHPQFCNRANQISPKTYSTRLKGGEEIQEHDDWQCIEDFKTLGLVEDEGTGMNPLFIFTPEGWELWYEFQTHIANNPRQWSATFVPNILQGAVL